MICLDTTFLIDFLKQRPFALAAVDSLGDEEALTTEVNVHEMLVGFYVREGSKMTEHENFMLDGLLTGMRVLPFDRKASHEGARIAAHLIRTGKKVETADLLIAGSMRANGCTRILTRNVSDFAKISGIEVVSY